jgi:hypothetical protein
MSVYQHLKTAFDLQLMCLTNVALTCYVNTVSLPGSWSTSSNVWVLKPCRTVVLAYVHLSLSNVGAMNVDRQHFLLAKPRHLWLPNLTITQCPYHGLDQCCHLLPRWPCRHSECLLHLQWGARRKRHSWCQGCQAEINRIIPENMSRARRIPRDRRVAGVQRTKLSEAKRIGLRFSQLSIDNFLAT